MPTATQLLPPHEVKIPFGEEVLTVSYNRAAITPAIEREYSRLLKLRADDDDNRHAAVLFLVPKIITSWDMQMEDGEVMPITEDAIREHLPLEVLLPIVGAVFADNSPKATNESDSNSTSKPEDS